MRRCPVPAYWAELLAIAGGLLWVVLGSVLALRPAREAGVSFRATTDMLPWLGLGLVLAAVALWRLQAAQQERAGRLGTWGYRGLVIGSALYALGQALRPSLGGGWEPAAPLGMLTTVLGFLVLGVATGRARVHPTRVARLLLVAGVSLLLFNDQYVTAWSAVPFGIACLVLGTTTARPDRGREAAPG